jgi:hypothetical protein
VTPYACLKKLNKSAAEIKRKYRTVLKKEGIDVDTILPSEASGKALETAIFENGDNPAVAEKLNKLFEKHMRKTMMGLLKIQNEYNGVETNENMSDDEVYFSMEQDGNENESIEDRAVDITDEFKELEGKTRAEKERILSDIIKDLIGAKITTKDGKIIGIQDEQIAHAKNKVFSNTSRQKTKLDVALFRSIKKVIRGATFERSDDVKSEHNKNKKTIEYKKKVAKTIFFKNYVKIGDDIFEVVIATHQMKGGTNANESYLYEAYVKDTALQKVKPTPQGSNNSIANNNENVNSNEQTNNNEQEPQTEQETQEIKSLKAEVMKLRNKYAPESKFSENAPMRNKRARGTYYADTKTIVARALNNLSVLTHEIAHAIDRKMKFIETLLNGENDGVSAEVKLEAANQLRQVYFEHYGGVNPKASQKTQLIEGLATLVQMMITDGDAMSKKYPKAWAYVMNNETFRNYIKDAKALVEKYNKMPAEKKIETKMSNPSETEGQTKKNKSLLSKEQQVIRTVFDKNYWAEVIDKLTGAYGKDSVYNWINMLSFVPNLVKTNLSATNDTFLTFDEKGDLTKNLGFNFNTIEKRYLYEAYVKDTALQKVKSTPQGSNNSIAKNSENANKSR